VPPTDNIIQDDRLLLLYSLSSTTSSDVQPTAVLVGVASEAIRLKLKTGAKDMHKLKE
jgi:hypothetical protein